MYTRVWEAVHMAHRVRPVPAAGFFGPRRDCRVASRRVSSVSKIIIAPAKTEAAQRSALLAI